MATTSNLGLNIVSDGDYVNPKTAFTDNFYKLDNLGLDYVVETGTKGNWWWRKWKKGRLEQGIDSQTFSTFTSLTPWGSMFMSDPLSFGDYAKPYVADPLVIIMFRSDTSGQLGGIIHISGSDQADLKTTCPNFRMIDAYSNPYTNPKFGIYVTGRYK